MTAPTFVSRNIVKLLFDADFVYRDDTDTWSHQDGRPFSEPEQAIAEAAGEEELEALFDVYKLLLERDLVEPLDAVRVLTYRYWITLSDRTATGTDLLAAMTDQHRAEYQRLLDALTPAQRIALIKS
ncbi:hypothetical protein [Kitasatospora purpeofusca]|uniref:hypothetical protein n=1 Tax=Kitasatospora purpeofusca TaxID=67352 RepID=UPI00224F18BB|nr:hypothetical protein [Kitasatospora purpeofusca]MCX4753468.1 hypothetical protein [Kitasatospora purpeofusca]WSR32964.1 hypothetical protein OG715_19425 [Kitasatospora purpeofusca]